MRILFLVMILGAVSSCSMMTNRRSFIDEMDRDSDGLFVAGEDFPVIAGDSGQAYRTRREVLRRTPSSLKEKQDFLGQEALQTELQLLENKQTAELKYDYLKNMDAFTSTSEKIYYLKIKDVAERAQYLRSRGLKGNDPTSLYSDREIKAAITSQDLLVGMSMDHVREAWGRPTHVSVAGNQRSRNERWTFYWKGKIRHVYFENGQVQGWSIE